MIAKPPPVEVFLYDFVGTDGFTASDMVHLLGKAKDSRVLLRINSPGGSVDHGVAIYNLLKRHRPGVDVQVDGVAASIASVIAMAGRKITMHPDAQYMLHEPWSFARGNAPQLRHFAGVLDKTCHCLLDIYRKRTKQTRSLLETLLSRESWIGPEQAIQFGFADEVLKD